MFGFPRIVMVNPKLNGRLSPGVLYAAKKVGIKEIYSFGGAQAIASLAYIQKVDKVVGPGNKFVAEAKRQLSGRVIWTESMFAGPSEICVLADKNSDIEQVATSLISQAEHDSDSQCNLVTKDKSDIEVKVQKLDETKPKEIFSLNKQSEDIDDTATLDNFFTDMKTIVEKKGIVVKGDNSQGYTLFEDAGEIEK